MEVNKLMQLVQSLDYKNKIAFAISLLENIESEVPADYSREWIDVAKKRLINSGKDDFVDAYMSLENLN